ncbi:gephyrin-like molybdotransferase Glp [Gynuella sunshinyii]|uniref:Molybdopterin molybdenumtransferase n=1 Tax=Gynuella sunshinyii YC6258 TaxID=1445510 RepID=A0A0C5VUL9_9GAMM|nr:gephyrin-like molybdotransferase Glp [Gynuella sunshinyii]AJQ97846.1 molybdopterin biosynthesis enzyme [Gynuella sunshinyii YC6258]
MSCCDTPAGLLPFETALSRLLAEIHPIATQQTVELGQSIGRVLAEPVISRVNVPPYTNSAMDGYAIHLTEPAAASYRLIGRCLAGHPFEQTVAPGECVRIMTGAQLPPGANCVVMQENATLLDDETVAFSDGLVLDRNIRHAGEDISAGATVYDAGHCINTADIAVFAALGIASVSVKRQLKVALLASGDELKLPGTTLNPGELYESNRPAIHAMLTRMGIEVRDFGIIADDKEQLKSAFLSAAEDCDAIITTGGVSVGEADYTKDILTEIGEVNFWKLAIKPGKPVAFGRIGPAVFFGLPGNPVSALVTFHQLAVPALKKMQGHEQIHYPTQTAIAASDFKTSPGRTDFQRGILFHDDQGRLAVRSTGAQGSHMLTSLTRANGYVILAPQTEPVRTGDLVKVQWFDALLG